MTVAAYFKFSPRNFGFVSSLRVWIVFPHPLVSILFLADISFPAILPHYPPNLLSIRAKETNETTRRRLATRQKILQYFAGTSGRNGNVSLPVLNIPIKFSIRTGVQEGSKHLKKKGKKRGVVVQRRKARVRNKNTV